MTVARRAHPLLYFILFLPFSASSGFVTVALGFLAGRHGIGVDQVAALAAMTLLPQTYKFLWAPLVDVWWRRKGWYLAGVSVTALTLALIGLVPLRPERLPLLQVLVFVNSMASAFVAMAVEGIMANATAEQERGRAAAWSQAGNLGGAALGGGLGLHLLESLPAPWMAAAVLALGALACSLALLPITETAGIDTGTGAVVRLKLKDVFRELWAILRSRQSVLALPLCFLPMGAGAAAGLFSAIAKDWRATAGMVELMNGWLSGIIMIAGCFLGGRLSDAMDRKAAYAVSGGILALVALAMGLTPPSPISYSVLCIAYSLVTGLCYGTFTGFVLELIGGGAASTKYNVFASLSNIPIWYMTRIDGWAAQSYGGPGMLLVDALAGGIGVAGLIVVFVVLRALRPAPAPAVSSPPAS